MCFILLSVQCPGGGSLPRTAATVLDPWGPETQAPPPPLSDQSQVLMEHPPCGLLVPADFSRAEGELGDEVHLLAFWGPLRVWGKSRPLVLARYSSPFSSTVAFHEPVLSIQVRSLHWGSHFMLYILWVLKIYYNMCLPLYYHTESFHCPKNRQCSTYSFLSLC